MLDLLDGLVERTLAGGASAAEAYAERSVSRRVKVYRQEVEELTAAQRRGAGVRAIVDGAVGYAYTSDLSDESLAETALAAVANARAADPDEHVVLPQPAAAYPDVSVHDPRLAASSDADRIDLALAVERAALAADKRVKLVEDTIYADGDAEVFLSSSTGTRGSFRENHCYAFAYTLAEAGGQVETGLAFTHGRALADLEPERCGGESARRACDLLGARKCDSMKATVVLDPYVAASFFGVLSSALTAEAVQKGRSLFAPLMGEHVAGPGVNLIDDGLHPDGLGSAPFDGEGVPCRRTPLIDDGVLRGFLHNTYTAHRGGVTSTGNGQRAGYSTMPGVGTTNLVLDGPVTPLADIVAGIEHGVLVTNAVGVHSGANPITGQFSVGISGLLIESGRITTPVREVTLAGEIVPMLRAIVALGDDARWIPSGSILTPSVAIEGLSIGGS